MARQQSHPDQDESPGLPRWVKITGLIAIVVALVVVIVLITGTGGEHGPGRHAPDGGAGDDPTTSHIMPSDGPGGSMPPPEDGHAPPAGGHG